MVTRARGRPFTGAGFRARFFKVLRELQAKRRIGSGLTFLGLRHTATKNLLDARCDERTAMSVTGHKIFAAFAVYAREADQRRLATDAIAKLEQKQWRKVLQNPRNPLILVCEKMGGFAVTH